jgi:phosphate:Na+ symporter
MGLGLILFGMQLMGEGTEPLRSYEPFIAMMRRMDNPLLAILASALFTGLIQSSSATTGVIIVLAGQGFITLDAGIALVFGANIGTCITAILACIGKPREAVRAAVVHVLFNVGGVIVWFAFIDQLAALCRAISPGSTGLDASARLAAETPRQIANAHTIFNVANTLLFIGFTGPMASLVVMLVPDRRERVPQPTYLDDILLRTPSLAMQMTRLELGRLGTAVLRVVRDAFDPVVEGSLAELNRLRQRDNEVDLIHGSIVNYLGRLSKENLDDELTRQLRDSLAVANYFENIGDMVETNLVEAGTERVAHAVQISDATREVLAELHARVAWAVERALEALVGDDASIANEVAGAKEEMNRLVGRADEHLAGRLAAEAPGRLQAFRVESDIVENFKRIYYFSKRIAKVVAEREIETAGGPPPDSIDLAPEAPSESDEMLMHR